MMPRPGARERARAHAMAVSLLAVAVVVGSAVYKGTHGTALADQYLRAGYTDVMPLFFTERLDVGAIPYLDHAVEYPVLTGLWMWLASLPATSATSFLAWTTVLLAASAAVTAWLLTRELGWRRALVFAAAPTLLVSAAVNWDLPSVALATAGIVAHRRRRDGWAGVWLGLGVAAKLWPGLVLVPVVLAAWRLRGRPAGLRTGGAALGAWAAVNVPVMLAAPRGWFEFVRLNRERPIDWDPLWAVVREVTGWAPPEPVLNLLIAVMVVIGVAAVMLAAARTSPPERWHQAALALVVLFLLTNKVYSPQFSLWLLPLLALTFPGWGWVAAFAVTDVAVSVLRFGYLANFVDGLDGGWAWWPFGTALVLRALVLVGAVVVGWRRHVSGAAPVTAT